jgi:hypothetical protein
MTEQEWLGCTNPHEMLAFLRGKVSERKQMLLAVACCRRVWPLLLDQRSRDAVEVVERYADGQATREDTASARVQAGEAVKEASGQVSAEACMAAYQTTHTRPDVAARETLGLVVGVKARFAKDSDTGGDSGGNPWAVASMAELTEQASFVRDLFGNPFHPYPPGEDARRWEEERSRWLRWNENTVPNLAAALYAERRFSDLPILADALEDAGCTDSPLLSHCRQPGAHVRGCWVVDLLLKKS